MALTLGAWLHDLNPFLVKFGDGFGVRWYGLAYVSGFLVGWALLQWLARRRLTPLSPARISDAMMMLILGVVAGGRLGYVAFYQPPLFINFSPSFPWWGVLRLTEGGMSSHGGMLGVILASWFIARGGGKDPDGAPRPPVAWLHVVDLMALACTPGLFFGRIANFINGELLGEIAAPPGAPAPWWAVKFPQEAYTSQAPTGQAAALRPIVEPFRLPGEGDEAAFERVVHQLQAGGAKSREVAAQLSPVISARHPSQLYQAIAEGLVLGVFLLLLWRSPRKPGVIGCWFLIAYGVMRILTELIRLPDANLAVQRMAGLSRGQWLSVAMIAAGSLILTLCVRRDSPTFGGWGVRKA